MTARRQTGTSRWQLGLRAAVAMAVPVVAGWAAGDIGAGLIACLGAFTARFGGDRPYANRAGELLVLAVALSSAVALGSWAAQWPWAGIAMVSAVGVAAVWLCNSLAVGPPGAYVFVVGCAAGVGTSATHLPPWVLGLLVLAGAAVGWLVQMSGAVTGFRGPERRAVLAASQAVADYIRVAGSAQQRAARQRAGAALYRSWTVLVAYQPVPVPASSVVHALRDANRALHMVFTDTVADVSRGVLPAPDAAEQALRIGRLEPGPAITSRDKGRIPLLNPPARTVLGRAVSPGSHIRNIMVRVAIGVPLAGSLATLLNIGHSYWAMAAAVLVLHEGADRSRTLRRGSELLLGTWAGLGLAGAIMLMHPHGLWLALLLGVLQFCIAIAAPRSYTLAAIFITATALTVASGAHSADIGWLLLSRGCDVLVGCAVGVAVYLVAARYQESDRLPEAIARTLDAVADAFGYLAAGDPATFAARNTRRNVQVAAITLAECDEAARCGTSSQRQLAERLQACAIATEQLAYRTIAACWTMERQSDTVAFARALLGPCSVAAYLRDLRAFAAAVRGGTDLPDFGSVPSFLVEEIAGLQEAFTGCPAPSTGASNGDIPE